MSWMYWFWLLAALVGAMAGFTLAYHLRAGPPRQSDEEQIARIEDEFQNPKRLLFGLEGTEFDEFRAWEAEHDPNCKFLNAQGAIGGRFTFSFTRTTIGNVSKVRCACGAEKDLTDYGAW